MDYDPPLEAEVRKEEGRPMALWVVRAGGRGESEAYNLENGIVSIAWNETPDLTSFKTREDLQAFCTRQWAGKQNPHRISNWIAQLWAFGKKIEVGDTVLLPLKGRSAVAIGRVTGPYKHRPDRVHDAVHTIQVKWLRTDVPRNDFDSDLLLSMGALQTVFQIQRNNAEQRVQALLRGEKVVPPPDNGGGEVIDPPERDLERYAMDQIRDRIGERFKGHAFARLVDAVLRAQGYKTQFSEPGPDGGVDIIAGKGPMGFDPPRLCVQVKSGSAPEDVKTLRELQGVMKNFNAQQGLLVAWGGFNSKVLSEARRNFFDIRLWDADDFVSTLLASYEELPEDIQADLPMKRVWALVTEE